MEDQQVLILPGNREKLLVKLNSFKTATLNEKEIKDYEILEKKVNYLFKSLCWPKLGVSLSQLNQMSKDELDELALLIHEKSRKNCLIQTSILMCIPIIGWIILGYINDEATMPLNSGDVPMYQNLRYYRYYNRMMNKYNQKFSPQL